MPIVLSAYLLTTPPAPLFRDPNIEYEPDILLGITALIYSLFMLAIMVLNIVVLWWVSNIKMYLLKIILVTAIGFAAHHFYFYFPSISKEEAIELGKKEMPTDANLEYIRWDRSQKHWYMIFSFKDRHTCIKITIEHYGSMNIASGNCYTFSEFQE
ncbi:hypothetical protein [Marinicrinis sediminis]|uniref:Uncharacterized protein n=1 Tax=Marinicrinis sediminis TaxID=1652465 RepID=A0ABW5RAR3_9BACL